VSDDPEVTTVRGEGPAGYLLPPRMRLPDATADPARLARRVLEAVVPGFADAAGVFVLEQLVSAGNPAGPGRNARSAGLVARRLAAGSTVDGKLVPRAALPPGKVIAFAADSVCARCVHDQAPVIFAQPDRATLQRITPEARTAMARYTSYLAAPMIARGTAVGLLVLARTPRTPTFRGTDTQAAADLAARAGAAIACSLALMRHRSVAEALQPPRPAVSQQRPGRLEITGRCLPAAGYDAGGDWYDIISLPAGRTGLIVGDVMGHGPQAAAGMARLSTAAYTLADLDLPPAEVLRQLNRTSIALPSGALATCAYAVIDPSSRSCALAAAGHLPPVLALPDGTTRVPDLPGGQSLGVGPASYGQARIKLPPGTILALYTDGLVETRTRPFDQGILALRSVLARQHPHLDAACGELIASLGQRYEDDITIVLARIQ
jgi:Stage II sporulation protein E (SpoIIE)/GAF domain